jgi:hypothetical protein
MVCQDMGFLYGKGQWTWEFHAAMPVPVKIFEKLEVALPAVK